MYRLNKKQKDVLNLRQDLAVKGKLWVNTMTGGRKNVSGAIAARDSENGRGYTQARMLG